jgi:hypothetical protein
MVPLIGLLVVFFVLLFVFIWLRIEVTRLTSAEAIAGVVVQLGKAKNEILAKLAALEAAAAAGEDLSGPLAVLAAAAQSLDDVVPDAVVEAPVEAPVEVVEAPVEVPAEPVVEGEQV